VFRSGQSVAFGGELRGHGLAVPLIHLAAVGLDIHARHDCKVGSKLGPSGRDGKSEEKVSTQESASQFVAKRCISRRDLIPVGQSCGFALISGRRGKRRGPRGNETFRSSKRFGRRGSAALPWLNRYRFHKK